MPEQRKIKEKRSLIEAMSALTEEIEEKRSLIEAMSVRTEENQIEAVTDKGDEHPNGGLVKPFYQS
ncbi:hypothetical protein [Oceanobacillus sp. FSL W7-1309]|uniref:hypothetical protein n=1 Tax=Oceanobacillus sp. FSL W7-1309 TaxID=2954539 RepID=UPI0030F6BC4C